MFSLYRQREDAKDRPFFIFLLLLFVSSIGIAFSLEAYNVTRCCKYIRLDFLRQPDLQVDDEPDNYSALLQPRPNPKEIPTTYKKVWFFDNWQVNANSFYNMINWQYRSLLYNKPDCESGSVKNNDLITIMQNFVDITNRRIIPYFGYTVPCMNYESMDNWLWNGRTCPPNGCVDVTIDWRLIGLNYNQLLGHMIWCWYRKPETLDEKFLKVCAKTILILQEDAYTVMGHILSVPHSQILSCFSWSIALLYLKQNYSICRSMQYQQVIAHVNNTIKKLYRDTGIPGGFYGDLWDLWRTYFGYYLDTNLSLAMNVRNRTGMFYLLRINPCDFNICAKMESSYTNEITEKFMKKREKPTTLKDHFSKFKNLYESSISSYSHRIFTGNVRNRYGEFNVFIEFSDEDWLPYKRRNKLCDSLSEFYYRNILMETPIYMRIKKFDDVMASLVSTDHPFDFKRLILRNSKSTFVSNIDYLKKVDGVVVIPSIAFGRYFSKEGSIVHSGIVNIRPYGIEWLLCADGHTLDIELSSIATMSTFARTVMLIGFQKSDGTPFGDQYCLNTLIPGAYRWSEGNVVKRSGDELYAWCAQSVVLGAEDVLFLIQSAEVFRGLTVEHYILTKATKGWGFIRFKPNNNQRSYEFCTGEDIMNLSGQKLLYFEFSAESPVLQNVISICEVDSADLNIPMKLQNITGHVVKLPNGCYASISGHNMIALYYIANTYWPDDLPKVAHIENDPEPVQWCEENNQFGGNS